MLSLDIKPLATPISYSDSLLLIGSCFTEHINDRLISSKFRTLQNPNGILFNPLSVADSINSYILNKQYQPDDLFYLNELWNSWHHHTRFSHTDQATALTNINQSQAQAHQFLRSASWVIITLGSAYQYFLKDGGLQVANNHRAPAQWFEKRLLPIQDIVEKLSDTIYSLRQFNPDVQLMFTISPVRHIRDGVVDNNRSKARLLEAVHQLCATHVHTHYFPAYELVIDVLRDYRFYDVDFVHPNYQATSFVWQHFANACIANSAKDVMAKVAEITTARAHRTRFPNTDAHRKFMHKYAELSAQLMAQYPDVDLSEELQYFNTVK